MEKKKQRNKLLLAAGGAALAAASVVIAPKAINFLSDKFYKKPEAKEEDDWDPVIVKKRKGKVTEDGEL